MGDNKNNDLKRIVKSMDKRINKLDEFIEKLQIQLTLAGDLYE